MFSGQLLSQELGVDCVASAIVVHLHARWALWGVSTVLALNFKDLYLLKRYLDTQPRNLQHPVFMSNCYNSLLQYGT